MAAQRSSQKKLLKQVRKPSKHSYQAVFIQKNILFKLKQKNKYVLSVRFVKHARGRVRDICMPRVDN